MKTIYRALNAALSISAGEDSRRNKFGLFLTYLRFTFGKSLGGILGGDRKTARFLGYKMAFFEYSTFRDLFNEIFVFREYEFNATSAAPVIIDCGSNVGVSVLYFKYKYPGARVVAFEPDRQTFEVLEKNIRQNALADVELHQAALGAKDGLVVFYSDADRAGSPGMSITQRLTEKNRRVTATEVSGTRLSSHIEGLVDLIKLDVEGAEVEVLRDLCGTGKIDLVREMFIEYHFNKTNPDNKLGELLGLLEAASFKHVIKAPLSPPFFKFKEKPHDLVVFAYR